MGIEIIDDDLKAGNYVLINAECITNWAQSNNHDVIGAKIVNLMHETGHSIGIFKPNEDGGEEYDIDHYSVMSYMKPENSNFIAHWYYSWEYWETRNDYY